MVRIKNPKAKGSTFERIVKKLLLGPETEVFRSPASLGSADLISVSRSLLTPNHSVVCMIQCKYLKKYMSKKETIKIKEDAERLGAWAYLAYREKPRGKIMLDQLWPETIPKTSY